jgi:putative ABC transport system permease protein
MADRYWPGQDPVGRSFATAADPKHPLTIVGVVGNVRMNEISGPFEVVYYRPLTQSYEGVETLQIRSGRSPQELLSEVKNIAQSLSPTIPIYGVRTMTEALHGGNGLLLFELGATLAAGLGLLGLVLTLVGLYGLTSYTVSQRTQELGIRMALGAQRRDILRLVGRQGFLVIVAGLTAGLLAALTIGQLVGDFLVGIPPTDPITFVVVPTLLAMIVMLATFVPVRRASRVDPMHALRHE